MHCNLKLLPTFTEDKWPQINDIFFVCFQLKPYVSYRVKEVVQAEFTAVDLFDAIYRPKIEKDFEENKLDENGQPLEPNAVEMLTAEEAKEAALKTGSDLFTVNKQPAY